MTKHEEFLETATEEDIKEVAKYQELITTGAAWRFKGSVGQSAMTLLRSGICELGEKGHRDFWGNYIPSKSEVRPNTMGAPLRTRFA